MILFDEIFLILVFVATILFHVSKFVVVITLSFSVILTIPFQVT